MTGFSLSDLQAIVRERAQADPKDSWTAKLVSAGIEKAAKKLGEEATETVIAAVAQDQAALVAESADLLYHWLVVLHLRGIALDDVMAELARRTKQSGLAEKAGRG